LALAEAIADLIEASSEQAARNALRSLQGEFSKRVHELTERLINLRIYVEAAIDFPEEEIDFLADGHVLKLLDGVRADLAGVLKQAGQGALLREGMTVVIAGRPNAGKSSLLNALAGREAAIVTAIAGTTRDVLREHIHIDGMPLHVVDTAGLRDTDDHVEKIGVERALKAINDADRVLLVVDASAPEALDPFALWPEFLQQRPDPSKLTLIRNKTDLSNEAVDMQVCDDGHVTISLSAKSTEGLDLLREHLKTCMGYEQTLEGSFSARRRHLDALKQASSALEHGRDQLTLAGAGELLAEDLRQAQQVLGEITGAFSSDDLLGRIFSSFCIGK
jgi:tRNA modification GTPase